MSANRQVLGFVDRRHRLGPQGTSSKISRSQAGDHVGIKLSIALEIGDQQVQLAASREVEILRRPDPGTIIGALHPRP